MLGLGLGLVLGLDYGLGFSSDIRLRHDPQLRVSHLAKTNVKGGLHLTTCPQVPLSDLEDKISIFPKSCSWV